MKCMHMISRDRDHSEGWGTGGGGQLLFGTIPKNHPFWYPDPSLRLVWLLEPSSKCVLLWYIFKTRVWNQKVFIGFLSRGDLLYWNFLNKSPVLICPSLSFIIPMQESQGMASLSFVCKKKWKVGQELVSIERDFCQNSIPIISKSNWEILKKFLIKSTRNFGNDLAQLLCTIHSSLYHLQGLSPT